MCLFVPEGCSLHTNPLAPERLSWGILAMLTLLLHLLLLLLLHGAFPTVSVDVIMDIDLSTVSTILMDVLLGIALSTVSVDVIMDIDLSTVSTILIFLVLLLLVVLQEVILDQWIEKKAFLRNGFLG